MSKVRMVNTRFWNDGFISQLDPIEKLLFMYFLTNEHTNISGIYELPMKIAAIETGIDASMFAKILPRLESKIVYFDGWVCVKNFPKYQHCDNPKVKIGIENELSHIPSHILQKAIGYGYPIDGASHLNLYLDSNSNLNSLTPNGVEVTYQEVNDEGQPIFKRKGMKKPVTEAPYPFSYEYELQRLAKSPAVAHQIAALYLVAKSFHFDNREQYEPALARIIKAAKPLKAYDKALIEKTMKHCQSEWDENWTLETVEKWIPQVKAKPNQSFKSYIK